MPANDLTEFTEEGQTIDQAFGGGQEQSEKETSEESSTETNQEQQEESSTSETAPVAPVAKDADDKTDDSVPFHQHPRWKEVYQKAKKVDELEAQIAELRSQPKAEAPAQPQGNVPKPKWFTDVYGDNDDAWRDYQSSQQEIVKQAETRAIERIRNEQQSEATKAAKAQKFVQDSVQALRDEGHKFDENKLMKVMSEYRPVDETGANWDFKRGLEIYQLMENKPSSDAKKKVAASTMKSKSDAGSDAEPVVWTPSKLREKYGYR